MQRRQWIKSGKNLRNYRHGSWRKSETKKKWSKKQGIRAEKFISRHWWISVISRIRSWSLYIKYTKTESYSEVTLWKIPCGVILLSAKIFRIFISDGKTPYERRFGMPFNRPVIPFGAMVEYHPFSAKDISRLNQFGPKVLPGIFLGYVLCAGRIWKGDIVIADIEEEEEMDASEVDARRLNAKERLTPMKGENFVFPVADGTVKTPGGDRGLRPSTSIRDRPDRGEGQEVFRRESDELFSKPSSRWLNTRWCRS